MTMTTYTAADRHRSIALAAATAALVGVPIMGPLLASDGERVERYDTVITPPNYAFAIWGPIFAGCAANAVQHATPRLAVASANRRSGWPLALAYSLSALWSVAAQADQFRLTPAILPAAAGCAALAYRRLQEVESPRATRLAPLSTGLLLGWLALAATVNLAAGALLAGAPKEGRATVAAATVATIGVAGAIAATVVRSRRGFVPLSGAAIWGLATAALTPGRPRAVRISTACGAALVASATALKIARG
jgi:hypothetical protein